MPAEAQEVFVSSQNNNSITVYSRTATGDSIPTRTVIGGLTELNNPTGLALGPDGNLYVASLGTHQVLRYNGTTGSFNNKGES